MKAQAGKVDMAGEANANPKKKYAGNMQHLEKSKAGNLPQGGKPKAKGKPIEDSAEDSTLGKMVGAGKILHAMPMNHLKEQKPVHEAAGFVTPKEY